MVILLDNGHGCNTPGKRSPVWEDGTQLFEYEFNRDLVKRIIRGCGDSVRCVEIVPEIEDISLAERCKRANLCQRIHGDCLFISIHANAGGGTGFEIFTSKGTTRADFFATELIVQLENDFRDIRMRKDFSDGDPDKESDFYVLKHTTMPALLAENLFMDNYKDCRRLLNPDFRQRLADSYVRFIKSIQ